MSNDSGTDLNTSFFSNLKNKVAYNLHQAVYDPNANQFAQQQSEQVAAADQQKDASIATTDTDDGDPNKFSAKRLAKKIGNQTWQAIQSGFGAFLALIMAMIVVNDLIVYSPPIRIIFFIFTFLICFFAAPVGIVLGIFYLLKGGYSYYYNHMTERPKREIMPTIFALAPITTYKPASALGSFLMYPFTYPKSEESAQILPIIMKQYWEDLKGSFKDLDTVKNLPIFADGLKKIQQDIELLHHNPPDNNVNSVKNAASSPAVNNASSEKGI